MDEPDVLPEPPSPQPPQPPLTSSPAPAGQWPFQQCQDESQSPDTFFQLNRCGQTFLLSQLQWQRQSRLDSGLGAGRAGRGLLGRRERRQHGDQLWLRGLQLPAPASPDSSPTDAAAGATPEAVAAPAAAEAGHPGGAAAAAAAEAGASATAQVRPAGPGGRHVDEPLGEDALGSNDDG